MRTDRRIYKYTNQCKRLIQVVVVLINNVSFEQVVF